MTGVDQHSTPIENGKSALCDLAYSYWRLDPRLQALRALYIYGIEN